MTAMNSIRIDEDEEDDADELDLGGGKGGQTAIPSDAEMNDDEAVMDDDDDVVSMCSDGSELSVGQEASVAAESSPKSQQSQLVMRLSHMGDVMALCTPSSAFSSVGSVASVNPNVDNSDARSSGSAEETMPHIDEGTTSPHSMVDSFAMANALRIPAGSCIVPRNNATQFQEELLRKSHLYAEELMKQQLNMQLMAAARASAFTLRQQNFRGQAAVSSDGRPPLAGIHSHLSAISTMSQISAAAAAAAAAAAVAAANNSPHSIDGHAGSGGGGSDTLARLSALSRASGGGGAGGGGAAGLSNLHQLQAQMQAHLPLMQQHNNNNINNNNNNNHNNNNLNESALKFSIDNILKADFGRRISDPLRKRGFSDACGGGGAASARLSKANSQGQRIKNNNNHHRHHNNNNSSNNSNHHTSAMDLTSLLSSSGSVPAGTSNFSNSLANICTNSNDSSSTAQSSSYGGGGGGGCGPSSDLMKSPSSQTGGRSGSSSSPPPMTMQRDNSESAKVQGGGSSRTREESGCGGGGDSASSASTTATTTTSSSGTGASGSGPIVWPAWVYCTRYSDRPSSGRSPRARKPKKTPSEKGPSPSASEDKRPRTAFSGSQLARLKHEFTENRYLTEKRRQQLSAELGLNEAQIKIWFQNKRAKLKKSSGHKNPLALQLMAQGLYNHSTVPLTKEEEELAELQERENAASNSTAETVSN